MGLELVAEELTWSFAPGSPFFFVPRLAIEAGALVSITGPSGAGKSTLLSLLAGLDRPETGLIRWGTFDLARSRGRARDRWRRAHLGLVFQDFQLVPELTAVENVLLPLTFDRWTVSREDRNRAVGLLERLGVARVTGRASTLSRGEQQRTAVARALLGRPPVLLADEPTASLDSAAEESVVGLLCDFARAEGATLVVATHQAGFQARADRRLRLAHGVLSEEA